MHPNWESVKAFDEIPEVPGLPLVGTLLWYLPYIGKRFWPHTSEAIVKIINPRLPEGCKVFATMTLKLILCAGN